MEKKEKKGFSIPLLIGIIVVIVAIAAFGIYYFFQKNLNEAKAAVQERAQIVYDCTKSVVEADGISNGVATGKRKFSSVSKDDTFGGKINSLAGIELAYEAAVTLEQSKIVRFVYEDFEEDIIAHYIPESDKWEWDY